MPPKPYGRRFDHCQTFLSSPANFDPEKAGFELVSVVNDGQEVRLFWKRPVRIEAEQERVT